MRREWIIVLCALACAISATAKDKVLFINSYHEGFAWSDGITEGVKDVLGDQVDLKIVCMDTKRNPSDEFKKQAAESVKKDIEEFQPDVIIAADDNASKFVIVPYYKNVDTPVVFCGVNWDATEYGFPCKNITGMIEVTPLDGLVEELKKCTTGTKLGFIGPDTLTCKKEYENMVNAFGLDPVTYFAKGYEDYKKGFLQLQEECDYVILDADGGLYDDKMDELIAFCTENTKVPTGSCYDFMSNRAIFSFAKVAQEQGQWAAQAALDILGGKSPSDIPVAKNKQGNLLVNGTLIEATGIEIPYEIIENATIVE